MPDTLEQCRTAPIDKAMEDLGIKYMAYKFDDFRPILKRLCGEVDTIARAEGRREGIEKREELRKLLSYAAGFIKTLPENCMGEASQQTDDDFEVWAVRDEWLHNVERALADKEDDR